MSSFAATRDDDSIRKWREDIDYFQRELPRRHPNAFMNLPRNEFDSRVAALRQNIPTMRDDEIVVALSGIIAALGPRNGHTRVVLRTPGTHYLPLSFYPYPDGLFIRTASNQYAGLVGARLIAIGGTPADAALAKVESIASHDNEWSRKSFASDFLSITEVLRGLNVIASEPAQPVTIEVADSKGNRQKVAITPVTSIENLTWVDLRDAHPIAYRRFSGRNPFDRHANAKNFWYDYDEAAQLLYVNYSGVSDMPDETVAAFFDKVFAFADAHPVKKFVLDVRNNGGGNNYLNRPIIKGLIARGNSIARKGTFFTLIGRATFSAAQNLVDALETYTDVTFVGEPTGGSPNSFGDALPLTLPNSKLTVLVASVWWQDVDPRDQRLAIGPEIAAQQTAAAEAEGRDVAMEAVRSYVAEPPLAKIVRDALSEGGRAKAEAAIRAWRADPRHRFITGESALVDLGVALYGENRPADAMTVFELNAQCNPDSWLAHNSLGRAYAAAKNTDAARAEFTRALQIRPNAPETIAALDRLNAAH